MFVAASVQSESKAKTEIAVGICQMMNLQSLDLLRDHSARRQKRGHDDHRAQIRRHAVRELQARQDDRAEATE